MKGYYDYEEGHYYITEPSTTGLSSVTRAFLGIVTKVLFIILNLYALPLYLTYMMLLLTGGFLTVTPCLLVGLSMTIFIIVC